MSNINKKRIEWLDLTKFIAIFSMVWAHIGVTKNVDIYIHAFHMPIFFFLAGYVLNITKYKDIKHFIKKKICTLIVPYVLFAFFIFIFWNFIYFNTNREAMISIDVLIVNLFTVNTEFSVFAGVQWFLTCLFWVEIIFYIFIKFKVNKYIKLAIILLLSIIGFSSKDIFSMRLWMGIDVGFMAITFFAMGYFLKSKMDENVIKKILNTNNIYIGILGILSIIMVFENGYINMRKLIYGNYFKFYIAAILCIAFFLTIAIKISEIQIIRKNIIYKILLYIGENTIIVLMLNQVFNTFYKMVRMKLALYINLTLLDFLVTVVVMIMFIPTIYIINKYFPILIGKYRRKYRNY